MLAFGAFGTLWLFVWPPVQFALLRLLYWPLEATLLASWCKFYRTLVDLTGSTPSFQILDLFGLVLVLAHCIFGTALIFIFRLTFRLGLSHFYLSVPFFQKGRCSRFSITFGPFRHSRALMCFITMRTWCVRRGECSDCCGYTTPYCVVSLSL